MKLQFKIIALLVLSLGLSANNGEDIDLSKWQSKESPKSKSNDVTPEQIKMLRNGLHQIYGNRTYKGKKIGDLSEAEMKEFVFQELKNAKQNAGEKEKALKELVDE